MHLPIATVVMVPVSPQAGVLSHQPLCNSTRVLQLLFCARVDVLHQRVGAEERAAFHKVCGSVSGCGRGAGTAMPSGRHHQDGVHCHSLGAPLWRREYRQAWITVGQVVFLFLCFMLGDHFPTFLSFFYRFRLSGKQWKTEESYSVNPEENTPRRELKVSSITVCFVVYYNCSDIEMASSRVNYNIKIITMSLILLFCHLWIKCFWSQVFLIQCFISSRSR